MVTQDNPYEINVRTMPEPHLARHAKYGLDLRHDLYDVYGNLVAPAWNPVVSVGQPDDVVVRRRGGPVDVVITGGNRNLIAVGQVFLVDSDELLIAVGELVGRCRCTKETNSGCQKFRGV
jgi:hypothetical protein